MRLSTGTSSRLGASWDGRGTNFALFSANAQKVEQAWRGTPSCARLLPGIRPAGIQNDRSVAVLAAISTESVGKQNGGSRASRNLEGNDPA